MGQHFIETPLIVLVVEDEPLIRMVAEDMIMDAGFIPISASDACDAIRLLEDREDISIIFTDIDLPGGPNGLDLARNVRARWPSIEIIITTGRTAEPELQLPPGSTFVPKPYLGSDVEQALRGSLPGGPPN